MPSGSEAAPKPRYALELATVEILTPAGLDGAVSQTALFEVLLVVVFSSIEC
jgi:hypothetical protein